MQVVLAGGSGFLGRALARALRADGHTVVVLTRRPRGPHDAAWSGDERDRSWWPRLDGVDVVVNLAGESIAGGRWTAARKTAILQSRVAPTRAIVSAIGAARQPPPVLLGGSAIGIYGSRGDEVLDERSSTGDDFLAEVGRAWEHAAAPLRSETRLVLLRTGLVLDRAEGALPQLALPFRFCAGGPAGTGRQYMSWIHVDDWVGLTRWAMQEPSLRGPLNLTAPEPVTNAEFARLLGRVLHRPALLPAPAFALRLLLGEMADALVLGGQRVRPARALDGGFRFAYPTLVPALQQIFD